MPLDALTGAQSRYWLRQQLRRELESARSTHQPLSVVRLNIARFKQLNDTFGHRAGDEVLKQIARIARRHLAPTEALARNTGDEFVVLSPGRDRDGAAALAETLRAEIAAHTFDAAGPMIQDVAVWVGLAQANEQTVSANDLLRAASPARRR